MSFHDGVWKYYIAARSRAIANCLITFRVLGKNKLSGLIKIVGDPHPYPFHLFGRVLPTEIRIKPSFVHKRIQVFQEDKIHFYIDNYSPTNTKLMMWLVSCIPRSPILAVESLLIPMIHRKISITNI